MRVLLDGFVTILINTFLKGLLYTMQLAVSILKLLRYRRLR
jgi:hypothetical protein